MSSESIFSRKIELFATYSLFSAYLKAFERAKYDPNVGLVVRGPLPEEYEYMQLDHSLDDRNNFSDLCCNEPYFPMTAPRIGLFDSQAVSVLLTK